ncbi:MAG TPA: hypothetical protein VGO96_06080 [Pyrinomonadaceae bacterium]|jgi:hypothetical protein|nr:hypothetical protein [Pyrinomonadaceae bacterium]
MQSEFDKEIDSLLRESARRGRATPAAPVEWGAGASAREEGDGGGVRATLSGAHLDADEQNAYAENSLPPSARTHYAAHLADCDDCRRSVTQLALAAGLPAQLEQQAATASGREVLPNVSWRERLGALFAPRAWRYAVPALALLLVSAVTLLVLLRGRQSETSVARNATTEQAKQPAALSETHHAPQSGSNVAATPAPGEPGVLSASNSNAAATKEELAAVTREDQGAAKTGAVLSDADAPPPPPASSVGAAASAPAPVAVAADDPVPMASPMPTAEPPVNTAETEQKTKVGERAEESAKDVQRQGNYENNQLPRERISGPRRNEQSRNVQRGVNSGVSRDGADKNDVALSKPTPASPPAARRAPPREADERRADGGASGDAKKSEDRPLPKSTAADTRNVAETRTVAGRKFRRAGSAWVDTAYNSSQAVTVVRRNSEQYRALVADEPELRRVSDALGGEITVVWKGRAYRIR